ncbi:MAG: PEPxxWA-CTERM sorting domain-containing protein [Alphaproteobacteria bacterium]|nr:PEPxxWA-CTERM sorting domain-containing protein [Alphaproteobacteria bacterium]MBU1513437.1 PEPxxWA-CTERM sorting domain-containing protein [Alphaproteobacteria bacterium]MBU2096429.1 PEPxxWA-CTERM sorting domain-containing protein [Alphaproteobacteria bacterium]MBU2149879.1 PEPxxWA-CTERM sorting domain-containing protein [Alphaproteobacteria bacterium]MBU2308215.1 PEPxxWA-CTERM sorting domain-containing protein [Alphaproteobacteria bacterium]
MTSKFFTALAGATAFCLVAGAAQADVTFIGYQTDVNANESLVTDFEGGPTLGEVAFLLPGYTLTGDAKLVTGTIPGLSAAPASAPDAWDTTQYLSVQMGQSATLDTPLLSAISFYVGSLDGYNSFTFNLADGTSQTVTGASLAELPGMDANGSQTAFTTNGRLTFSFASAIDSVVFNSGNYSLEVGNIGAVTLVPEPAAWAMMVLGFAGAGTMIRRRRPAMAAAA